MEPLAKSVVDYRAVLDAAIMAATGGVIAYLLEELPYLWRDAYLEMTPHPTDIVRWQRGTSTAVGRWRASGFVKWRNTAL
jgi:hypothetical protein